MRATRPRRRTACRLAPAVAALALSALAPSALAPSSAAAAAAPPGAQSAAGPAAAGATGSDLGGIMLVIDASGSMLDDDQKGRQKVRSAKAALTTLTKELPEGTPVGLRVFGEGVALGANKQTCTDTALPVPMSPLSRSRMVAAIGNIQARGWTPMGYALQRAGNDVRGVDLRRSSIVLVSDGVDECFPAHGPEPCAVARGLARSKVDLRVQTIGITVDAAARKQLQCIARVTGGRYWDASNADDLADALRASLKPREVETVAPAEPSQASPLVTALVFAVVAGAAWSVFAGIRSGMRKRSRAFW